MSPAPHRHFIGSLVNNHTLSIHTHVSFVKQVGRLGCELPLLFCSLYATIHMSDKTHTSLKAESQGRRKVWSASG